VAFVQGTHRGDEAHDFARRLGSTHRAANFVDRRGDLQLGGNLRHLSFFNLASF
jgi:hypothetical protein